MAKDRLDKILVKRQIVLTRSQAQQFILDGSIIVNGQVEKKLSHMVDDDDEVILAKEEVYVGRGAYKIEKAIKTFNIDCAGKIVADIGASTGGFTDYLLRNGASKVYAIDVGHGQLHQSLRENPAVINMEKTNIRDHPVLDEVVDFAVIDLSFISLRLTLNEVRSLVKESGHILALVKPQFEVGKKLIGKNGIVDNLDSHYKMFIEFGDWLIEHHFCLSGLTKSPIRGKNGNQEYLMHLDLASNSKSTIIDEKSLKEVIYE